MPRQVSWRPAHPARCPTVGTTRWPSLSCVVPPAPALHAAPAAAAAATAPAPPTPRPHSSNPLLRCRQPTLACSSRRLRATAGCFELKGSQAQAACSERVHVLTTPNAIPRGQAVDGGLCSCSESSCSCCRLCSPRILRILLLGLGHRISIKCKYLPGIPIHLFTRVTRHQQHHAVPSEQPRVHLSIWFNKAWPTVVVD